MTHPPMNPSETQPERTILAWQRTFMSVITVVGVGSLRLFITGEVAFTALAVGLCALAAIPIVYRQHQLRRGQLPVLTWQPIALVACIIAFAVAGWAAT